MLTFTALFMFYNALDIKMFMNAMIYIVLNQCKNYTFLYVLYLQSFNYKNKNML